MKDQEPRSKRGYMVAWVITRPFCWFLDVFDFVVAVAAQGTVKAMNGSEA